MTRAQTKIGELTQADENFCLFFIETGNQSDAYRRSRPDASGKPQTVKKNAKAVYVKPAVQKRIAELRARAARRAEVSSADALESLARAIRFDPRRLMTAVLDADGNLTRDADDRPVMRTLEVWELDDDTADALTGLEVIERHGTDAEGKPAIVSRVKKFKWLDKNAAREQAMKHLGLYEKDNRQQGDAAVRALVEAVGLNAGKFEIKP